MKRIGLLQGAFVALVTLTLAAGTARADDPKTIKVTSPDGSQIQVNTPTAGVAVPATPGVESLRYTCTDNRDLTIKGKVLTSPDGYVFRASGNCTLVLEDVVVSGNGIIEAKGNADVTVRNCTFTGASVAISIGGNAEAEIKNTVITAPAGLVVSSNAEVRLVDSTITAAETAIETRGMAVVDLKGTVTTGKRVRKGDSEINER